MGAARRERRDRARRGRRRHRAQRRRQEHAPQDPLPDHRADARAASSSAAGSASLLEVGTGFHPELTGRENIYLNGAILGMRRAEIARQVRRDRRLRRGRAVHRHAGEALLERHVRAARVRGRRAPRAGDPARRRGARGRRLPRSSASASARWARSRARAAPSSSSSHNLAIIQALCQRGIVLEGGRAISDAPTTEAIDQYLRTLERAAEADLLERTDRDSRGYEETRIRHVEVRQVGRVAHLHRRRWALGDDHRRHHGGHSGARVPGDHRELPRPADRDARQRGARAGGRARPRARRHHRVRGRRAAAAPRPLPAGCAARRAAATSRTACRRPGSSTSSPASWATGRCRWPARTATSR